jgi:hypothetical protein
MTTLTSSLPDVPHALAYQRIADLRVAAARRSVPAGAVRTEPVLGRVGRAGRSLLRWLWEGQLALVPPVVDPGPPCASC